MSSCSLDYLKWKLKAFRSQGKKAYKSVKMHLKVRILCSVFFHSISIIWCFTKSLLYKTLPLSFFIFVEPEISKAEWMIIAFFRERSFYREHGAENCNKCLTVSPGIIGKLIWWNLSYQKQRIGGGKMLEWPRNNYTSNEMCLLKAWETVINQSLRSPVIFIFLSRHSLFRSLSDLSDLWQCSSLNSGKWTLHLNIWFGEV